MFTDIIIGVIIGIGLERALKISFSVQKAIKQIKDNRKKKDAAFRATICDICGPTGRNTKCPVHGDKE